MTTHNQNTLMLRMRDTIRQIEEHEHPTTEDFYCNNLIGWMGERMKYVLPILDAAQAEIDELGKRENALAADAMKLLGEYVPVVDGEADSATLGVRTNKRGKLVHWWVWEDEIVPDGWEPLFRRVPTAEVTS